LESFANVLFTGNLRGATFIANGGRLDWISALWAFFSPLEELESVNRYDSVAGTAHDTVETCELESKTAAKLAEERASTQKCFVMDLHDVALCYEPGMEAMLVPAVRTGRPSQVQSGVVGGAPTDDQLGSGAPCGPSSGSLQMFAPVACVLAAAAVRVSTGEASDARGEQYNVWLRDVALHLLDTVMRKQALFNYTTDCMHRTGYVQVYFLSISIWSLLINSPHLDRSLLQSLILLEVLDVVIVSLQNLLNCCNQLEVSLEEQREH
jgi:hypothetical protein